MGNTNTGGPAFPVSDPFGAHKPQNVDEAKRLAEGMTLRDYFAAKAMQAMLADATNPDPSPSSISVWAYRHADAMLKARAE